MTSLFITNALIKTMNPDFPGADSLFIQDGRILALGIREKLQGLKNSHTEYIDLNGRTVLPGFMDAHLHLRALAESLVTVNLSPDHGISSISHIQERIHQETLKHPFGSWIRAGAYNEVYLAEQRDPTRWDLDQAAPHHPVRLTHRSGHAQVLNTLALNLLNITIETPDPPGGLMERDMETGEPNGIFYGTGDFLSSLMPPLEKSLLEQGVKLANQELIKNGITSFCDASSRNDLERWQSFAQWITDGILDSRVMMMLGVKVFREYQANPFPMTVDRNQLMPGPVKIILEETTGKLYPTLEDLNEIVFSIHKAGLQVAIHAIEEPGVEAACIAIEQALVRYPRKDPRHRIEHCSLCPPSLIRRIASSGIMVVSNPNFIYFSGDRYLKTITPPRMNTLYPFASLIKNNVIMAGGSDARIAPVNPLAGIYGAVTRRAREGGMVVKEEKIDVYAAIALYTKNAARSLFEEHQRGSIAPGKLADLVVLSDNPFAVDEEALKDIQVEMTIVGGRVAFGL
ncbi:MAG: amidohydrolase [Desulfobacterium sp.]|nr:amidohydrolase [Desulfobacterium sp.]MBU4038057.1 amidohydrolase [Pseudomonadota bacterium]